jgi:hypothetical protein
MKKTAIMWSKKIVYKEISNQRSLYDRYTSLQAKFAGDVL